VAYRPNADRLYETFKPPERLTLLLEAMARDDAAEAQRLTDSCPVKSYSGPDHGFHGRLDMAFCTVAVVCIDLRAMWAKLHMLHWVVGEVVPNLATAQQITATLAFVEGEQYGTGRRQLDFFAKPLPAPAEADVIEESDDEEEDEDEAEDDPPDNDEGEDGDDDEVDEPCGRDLERGQRMAAVEKRAEHFTACSVLALTLAAQETAQEMVNTWEALGRFCRTRVGVAPETMLAAWGFPVAGDFEETLKRYAHLKPQPEKVKEYTHFICVNWDRLYGRRRHDGGDADDDLSEKEGCDGE
jgi:hypothetical protein